nr:unnamed protein product [Callosobruchus analis]
MDMQQNLAEQDGTDENIDEHGFACTECCIDAELAFNHSKLTKKVVTQFNGTFLNQKIEGSTGLKISEIISISL